MSIEQAFCRIGVDVGGTFTDFVLANQRTGAVVRYKEPSVPQDPSLSIERGVPKLLELAGVEARDVGLIVHGTTIALNATIQRRGVKLGMVVSRGNRGVLEIARAQMPSAFDFAAPREEALVPRDLVLETSARCAHDGAVLATASPAELDEMAATFRSAGVQAVTVMLMHSFAHPELEREVAEGLKRRLQDVSVTASAAIWPEKREYERSMVALLNAYTQPLMEAYFTKLERRVAALGLSAPIYITANNGGILSLETARRRPIDTILSGPASGVVAASAVAADTGIERLITVDVGGTSADMAVVHDGRPANTVRARIGEFPLVLPVIGVTAIGAGGGSIVWVDPHSIMKVGPDSAGAFPGPICYGNGGTQPTITDCYLVAGLLDAARFLGGRIELDLDAARSALATIGQRLNFTGDNIAEQAAEAAIRVAAAVMATEMGRELAHRGDDPREYALLAFGGAGPTHASLVADEAGIATTVVPALPATFCALGAVLADVKRDYLSSLRIDLAAGAETALDREYAALESEAADWIAGEGDFLDEITYEYLLDMRYVGQGFDLQVMLPPGMRDALDAEALTALFHARHEDNYGYRDLDSRVIVTTQRVRVIGRMPRLTLPKLAAHKDDATPARSRQVFTAGRFVDVPVYDRACLAAGFNLRGPVLIEQGDTTIWVLPEWSCRADAAGNLVIENGNAAAKRT
ncbi:hydantoinase/oxoprolinase family protein [Nitratireductor sp. StC3]|uniref:hydantoinase/oxoprolinase family protein n=1 Tax=Nitratireductor sp. StC3 TaxID=2126741 RepID=UPI000D0E2FD9|nr:hydantoinase/oxoprolinase family protein [Nitratireductor sp. StC3]PSM16253.1 5-oxoprolinase [Nitratireductor sp. StC3]